MATRTKQWTGPSARTAAQRSKTRRPQRGAGQPGQFSTWVRQQQDWLILVGIALLTVATYARTVGHQFIAVDDPDTILDNHSIRELSLDNLRHFFTTPVDSLYTPLASLSYAVDYQLGGLDPAMYHTTNLLLHLANVVLVWLVVRTLTERPFLAHFAAVAFAIHPVNVDAVAWAATRSGLLSTLFLLASLLAYLRYAKRPRYWVLGVSILLYAVAALSNPATIVLPLILILVDYFQQRPYRRERRPSWRPILDKLPYVAISVAVGLVALHFRTGTVTPPGYEWYDRVVVICAALGTYVMKLFVPVHLAMAYAYPAKSGGHLPWYYYLAPVALVLVTVLLYRIRSARRIVVFGLGFFLITILLSQVVWLIDNHTANRYAYLPYVGLFLVAGHFVEQLLHVSEIRVRAAATGLLAGLIGLFAVVTVVSAGAWHDTMRVTTASIAVEPKVASVYSGRGIAEYNAKNYAAARQDFEKSLQLDPSSVMGHLYIGRIRHVDGDYAGAVTEFDEVIRRTPDFAVAYADRGKAKSALQDGVGALSDFSWAIGLDADLVDAYHQRGLVEIQVDNDKAALADFNRVIELMPEFADAYYYRGIAEGRLNDIATACADLHKAESLGQAKATEAISQACPDGQDQGQAPPG